MSTHPLDNQMPERLVTKVADLERQIKELRTLQAQGEDAINLQLSAEQSASVVLLNNLSIYFWFDLNTEDERRLFSMFEYSLYQGTVHPDNVIGSAFNVFKEGWEIWHHTDLERSDSYNVREVVWVRNKTGSTQTIHATGRWRYLIGSAEGAVSTT